MQIKCILNINSWSLHQYLFFLSTIFIPLNPQANTFVVEGSDLLMGIGPAEIARAGASSAATNDLFAVRWNPAGLVEIKQQSFALSRQLDSQLVKLNFIGFGMHKKNVLHSGLDATFALTWFTRLHIKTHGTFAEDSLETVFLEYALPGYPKDFIGTIESKTREYRFGVAIKSSTHNNLSLGMTLGIVKCGTTSCGVRASSPDNYHIQSTDATAYSLGAGIKYQLTEQIRLALAVQDFDTKVNVETQVISNDGIESNQFTTHLPTNVAFGMLMETQRNYMLSADYQATYGTYGSSSIDFRLLRLGLRKHWHHFRFNVGSIIPIRLSTGTTGNLMGRAPSPILPTAGLSWLNRRFTLDFVIYPNPIVSYQQEKLIFSAETSIAVHY